MFGVGLESQVLGKGDSGVNGLRDELWVRKRRGWLQYGDSEIKGKVRAQLVVAS